MRRIVELAEKTDKFFERVVERHGADMQCATGCTDCCHTRLTITQVEANEIRRLTAEWPVAQRRALAGPVAADRCAALVDGRCAVYAARPLVCRSHGAPIRMREGSLPVVRNCFRNFTATTPDSDCIVDQTTLSALLLMVDREAAGGSEPGPRVDLAQLIEELCAEATSVR